MSGSAECLRGLMMGFRGTQLVYIAAKLRLADPLRNMLVVLGGRERMEAEYRALCREAGLALQRTIPTGSALSLMECVPVRVSAGRAAALLERR